MSHFINTTREYHLSALDSLGWELTVGNALNPADSPCRRVLCSGDSYGSLLYQFLSDRIPMDSVLKMIEIGGGYGYLTRDFLKKDPDLQCSMLDISPYLLECQRETLKGHTVDFILDDFFMMEPACLGNFDLAILNENIGDFPTLCDIPAEAFISGNIPADPFIERAGEFFSRYRLEIPDPVSFNFNLGAAEAVEKLCNCGIPNIFISEHSCEASVPGEYRQMLDIPTTGNPERIRLLGHDEYTIRFSHLEKIARTRGYASLRGCYADFLRFSLTDEIRFILTSGSTAKDEHEIIRQFIGDLFKYEYLLLIRQ